MKYRSYKGLLAAVAAVLMVSAAACGEDQQTQEQQTQAQQTQEQQEPSEEPGEQEPEETAEGAEIVIPADMETEPAVDGLADGLCSWTTGGTEAGTINGNDYAFTPAIYINGGAAMDPGHYGKLPGHQPGGDGFYHVCGGFRCIRLQLGRIVHGCRLQHVSECGQYQNGIDRE